MNDMNNMNTNENEGDGLLNADVTEEKSAKKEALSTEQALTSGKVSTFKDNDTTKTAKNQDVKQQSDVFNRAQVKAHYMEQVTKGHTEKYISDHASELERNAERLTDAAEGSFKADRKMNAVLKNRKPNELETMAKIKLYLGTYGAKWHFEHVNEKTGAPKRMHFATIADILKKALHIANVKMTAESTQDESKLMYWNPETGLYEESEATLNALARICEECITTGEQHQVIGALKDTVELKTVNDWKDVVTCGNGYFRRGELYDYSYNVVFVSKLATNYNDDAIECPTFNGWNFVEWLENDICHGDALLINAFWQIIIRVVRYREQNDFCFWLWAKEGGTGKSTFLNLLKALAGEKNTGALKINQFADPFLLASAYDKALIIGDDNKVNALMGEVENFKTAVTGGTLLINPKNQKPFSAEIRATIVEASNNLPKFSAYDGGIERRIIPIKFCGNSGAYKEPDPRIRDVYTKDPKLLEYVLHEALRHELNDDFKELPEVVATKKEIEENSSPVLHFAVEYLPEIQSKVVPTEFVFKYYLACMANENRPTTMTRVSFVRTLNDLIEQGKVEGWQPSKYAKFTNWDYRRDKGLLNEYVSDKRKFAYDDHDRSGSNKGGQCFIRE